MLKVKGYGQTSGFCGPASLKMVLEYFGVKRSEKFLAQISGCTKSQGVKAKGLLKVAKKLGFRGMIKDHATFSDISYWVNKRKIPVIVDWFSKDDGHYSVVVKIDRKNIYLKDPEIGRLRKIDRKTFWRIWFDFPGDYIKTPKDLILRQMIVIFK